MKTFEEEFYHWASNDPILKDKERDSRLDPEGTKPRHNMDDFVTSYGLARRAYKDGKDQAELDWILEKTCLENRIRKLELIENQQRGRRLSNGFE